VGKRTVVWELPFAGRRPEAPANALLPTSSWTGSSDEAEMIEGYCYTLSILLGLRRTRQDPILAALL
jgi:hypothetical protein